VDLYDAKGDALAVLETAGIVPGWERTAPSWYHPGRSATLKLGPQILGYFGELHPRLMKAYDIKGPVVGFEIFLDRIPLPKRKTTAKPKLVLSPYQKVERDFAFVVADSVPADALIKAAKKADPALIEDITIFDVFDLGNGQKSIGMRVTLQPKDHTLLATEIQTLSQKVIASVEQEVTGDNPLIIAEVKTEIPTLTVGEAVMHLDLSNENAMLFKNTAHDQLNVVYRRTDGNIGWITPSLNGQT